MNILIVAIKAIRQNIKSYENILILVLFPIVLTLILGTALSSSFSVLESMQNTRILYNIQNSIPVKDAFTEFQASLTELGIELVQKPENLNGIQEIKNINYQAYIEYDNQKKAFYFYRNDRFNIKVLIIKAILENFITRFNLASIILAENPSAIEKVNNSNIKNFIEIRSLNPQKQPSALDYYGITMLTMFILLGAFLSAYGIVSERNNKTLKRMYTTPVNKNSIFLGILIGAFTTILLQILVIFSVNSLLLNIYYGENIFFVILILLAEAVLALSFGIGMGLLIKKENFLDAVMNIIIMTLVFLGDGFFRVPLSGIFEQFKKLSPIKWLNQALFSLIYNNKTDDMYIAIAICLGISLIIFILVTLKYSKEEAL